MKRIILTVIGIVFPLMISAADATYLIGPSDLLDISVWGEEALSRQVAVRSDGYISLPLAGDLLAADKTPPQLQKEIEASLTKFLKEPHCAVIVREPRSKRIYVQGQVTQPGEFILDREMTVTQVISMARGFTQWADTDDIIILRSTKGVQERLIIDYDRIIKGKDDNILIKPGDTIIIP